MELTTVIKLSTTDLKLGRHYTFITPTLKIAGQFLGIKYSKHDSANFIYVYHATIGEIGLNVLDIVAVK